MTVDEILEKAPGVSLQILTPTCKGYVCPTIKASSDKGTWHAYITTASGFSVPGVFVVAQDGADHSIDNTFAKHIVSGHVRTIARTEKDVFQFLFAMFVRKSVWFGGKQCAITNDSVEKIKNAVLSLAHNQYIFLRATTPRERYRLMGVKDKDIDKLLASEITDSGHYSLAGNSIVVPVLKEILRKMLLESD
jgi:site-specific DNA-cytosine methylase